MISQGVTNCTAVAGNCFPHVEPLLNKVVNNASLPVLSSCLHWPSTFLPVSVLPTISSLVKITLVNSVPKCTGPVIRGFVSIPWILALVAAETWCGPFTSARGGLKLILSRHGPLEAVLCGTCLLD